MKRILIASLTSLMVSCGTNSSTTSATGDGSTSPEPSRVLFPIDGTLGSVTVQAARGPAVGMWTNIEVEFVVSCTSRLEVASLSSEVLPDGNVRLFASALASSEQLDHGGPVCLAFSTHIETVTIPGFISAESIELINLSNIQQQLPLDTISVATAPTVAILSTRALCPAGVTCVTNGTVVTLGVTISSCNELAQVSFHADQARASNGKQGPLSLAVHAVELVSKQSLVAICASQQIEQEVTLIMQFGDQESIKLNVLQP